MIQPEIRKLLAFKRIVDQHATGIHMDARTSKIGPLHSKRKVDQEAWALAMKVVDDLVFCSRITDDVIKRLRKVIRNEAAYQKLVVDQAMKNDRKLEKTLAKVPAKKPTKKKAAK